MGESAIKRTSFFVAASIAGTLILPVAPSHAVVPDQSQSSHGHFRAATVSETASFHLRPGRGACAGLFEADSQDPGDPGRPCTHGPDFYEPATTVAADGTVSALATSGPVGTSIPCYSTGPFVHVFYVYPGTNYLDASNPHARRPLIREAIALADKMFYDAARYSKAVRHPRWRMSSTCGLIITPYKTDPRQDIDSLRRRLISAGKMSSSEKGLAFLELGDQSCWGLGQIRPDDRYSSTNPNNNGNMMAELDGGCLGNGSNLVNSAEVSAHELLHTLGAVQNSAPHSTGAFHCTDEWDDMCYDDGGPHSSITHPCATTLPQQIDCGKNDYFRVSPSSSSYLGKHWNTANSRFLSHSTASKVDALARPSVSISSPSQSSTVEGTFTATATATAPSGSTIKYVEFSVNNVVVRTDTSAPFTVAIPTIYDGSSGYRQGQSIAVKAVAVDSYYRTRTSSTRTVYANNPTVRLVSPGTLEPVDGLAPWEVAATAPPGRTVSSVKLFAGATQVAIDSSAPFEGTFPTASYFDGQTLSISAQVVDSAGVTRSTPARQVVVHRPTVSMVNPPPFGYVIASLPHMTLAATASSLTGNISSIEFFVDGSSVGSDSSAPYQIDWAVGSLGPYEITAVATDSNGGSSTSDVSTVDVDDPRTSVTAIGLTPSGNVSGSAVTLTATPTVTSGWDVSAVSFYLDGNYVGSDDDVTDGTYTTSFDTRDYADGPHTLTASVDATDPDTWESTTSNGTPIAIHNTSVSLNALASPAHGTITVGATASGPSATPIAEVDFGANGSVFLVDDTAPYGGSWDTTDFADGAVTISADAMQTWSQPSSTSTLMVTVQNLRATLGLSNGSTVSGTRTVTATVTKDSEAIVEWVKLYVDNVLVTSDGSSPYSFAWNTTSVANGSHSVKARIYTSDGRAVDSPSVTVTVAN